ncbi:hypothetical protein HBF26_17085 [Luteibacter jiangsuensis]|uniref:Helix-turn-helix protein n=1 Tax=Luteibacter jiangsuensis TaxID=637577 RepID=A0ABX0QAU6_9GAMM|nr:FaeA/PapI family transcriptional regulator [Luteibacter jiangsuensis]NID06612.1 hypothetical protein [Luteibacter jiangsuensis]
MTTTITPEEFEKALARACMKAANRWMIVDPFRCGDRTAVLTGPHLDEVAREAGLSVPQARRRMQKLQEAGKVLRHDTRGGSTCWWLVGLAPSPAAAPPAPISLPPFVPTVHATPSPSTAPRQGVTAPAPGPARQHWSDVLGVARDCSTSEAREAFQSALAAVDDLDLDAEQQRQRIRDAYNARLVEDGISE